jgi:dipeptide/tripeptide permease
VVPLKVVRILVIAICVMGIAGMIIGSLADNNNGAVVTFGLVAAVASLVLMSFTLATRSALRSALAPDQRPVEAFDGEELERRIQSMVAAGADEADIRALVGQAIRFGQQRSAT